MRLKNTGNLITDIKIKNKTVDIYFKDKKISLLSDVYFSSPLKIGDEVDLIKINALLEESNYLNALNYAFSLLKNKHFFESTFKEKLNQKFSNKIVKCVIKRLKELDLINDAALLDDYIEYYNEKLFGKYKILANLKKMDVPNKYLDKINFDEETEIEKVKTIINNKNKIKDDKSLYLYLIRQGYEEELILRFVKEKNYYDDFGI